MELQKVCVFLGNKTDRWTVVDVSTYISANIWAGPILDGPELRARCFWHLIWFRIKIGGSRIILDPRSRQVVRSDQHPIAKGHLFKTAMGHGDGFTSNPIWMEGTFFLISWECETPETRDFCSEAPTSLSPFGPKKWQSCYFFNSSSGISLFLYRLLV